MHNVLIVGCGNIAGNIDNLAEVNTPPRSHAKAYSDNKNFDIVACIDPDQKKLADFKSNWNISNGYQSFEKLLNDNIKIDIISICSPTEFHLEHLQKALKLKPKLVFCEKPIYNSLEETKKIIDLYRKSSVTLAVNYSRRFDKKISELKSNIDSLKYGKLRSITCHYNKGILNNGSHFLDLLINLLGDLSVDWVGDAVLDFKESDPTLPVALRDKNNTPILLVPGNSNDYSLGELDFIFSEARIKMINGGLYWSEQQKINSEVFVGYKELSKERFYDGDYLNVLSVAIENIHNHITSAEKVICSGNNATKVLKLYEDIMSIYDI